MNTHDIDIELPPPAQRIPYVGDVWTRDQVYAAVEADRKLHDRMLAHEWIRPSLGLDEDAPYRFDFYAQEIEKLKAELKKFGRNENDRGNDNDNRKRRFATGEALRRYLDCGGDEEPDPIERLRFYCSLAMSGQDWLDVEPFFDALIADRKRRGEPSSLAEVWRINADEAEAYGQPDRADTLRECAAEVERLAAPQPAESSRGETASADDSRSCAIADSNYAAGMLTGWNLCVADDEESFALIRGARLRAAAQASRDAKEQDSALQPAEPVKSLIESQEPLGEEFQKVFEENQWDLYIKSTEPVKEIELRAEDLHVSTYSPTSSPQWAAHNDRGVRIVHLPTGTVAESHEELSSHRNREIALDRLRQAIAAAPVKVDAKASMPSDDALVDALINLEYDNYEQSFSGYKNRQADIALIRAALARHENTQQENHS